MRNSGHEHDICQAQKAENTDPRTTYAVKYATARGHLRKSQYEESKENEKRQGLEGQGK